MYQCDKCGKQYDELPRAVQESFEMWGHRFRYSDGRMLECTAIQPNGKRCGGDLFEIKKCNFCGEDFPANKIFNGLCRDCVIESTDLDTAIKSGKNNTEYVEINGFLSSMFPKYEINQILTEHLKGTEQKYIKDNLADYVDANVEYFSERVNDGS